ncbi:hypothetical protein MWU52_11055 [Jannaschia sp. S6380]|uniref:hypothetical protein n=1 Tax=Jannaschia sp. S6380 TaxID=2926408 RepID=UPI001FF18F1F|nr:hypothetical protein [Jannaschia sp. S6380]MCK0168091.1 hypothetical protein [Jannaschia sp. S6380]
MRWESGSFFIAGQTTSEYLWLLDAVRRGAEVVDTGCEGMRRYHPDGRPVTD